MSKLNVSEVFYSIQGEGSTMGIPAVFLRLGGCNLLCESANWRCDTIEVWRKSKATSFENVLSSDLVVYLRMGAHLIITGGEPMMHSEKIVHYLKWFMSEHDFLPHIEIETNGTILPSSDLMMLVKNWNVSPKLSSAGEQNTKDMRINVEALNTLNKLPETIFKFVISCEQDIKEVTDDYSMISTNKIYLMPAGSTRTELEKNRLMTVDFCKTLCFKYSERLHVVIWNMKTGV